MCRGNEVPLTLFVASSSDNRPCLMLGSQIGSLTPWSVSGFSNSVVS